MAETRAYIQQIQTYDGALGIKGGKNTGRRWWRTAIQISPRCMERSDLVPSSAVGPLDLETLPSRRAQSIRDKDKLQGGVYKHFLEHQSLLPAVISPHLPLFSFPFVSLSPSSSSLLLFLSRSCFNASCTSSLPSSLRSSHSTSYS